MAMVTGRVTNVFMINNTTSVVVKGVPMYSCKPWTGAFIDSL